MLDKKKIIENLLFVIALIHLIIIFYKEEQVYEQIFQYQSDIKVLIKTCYISIIIETDDFDYQTYRKFWEPVIMNINLKVSSWYFYIHTKNKFGLNISDNFNDERKYRELRAISNPKIVFSDFPENGYLPLSIASYTENMASLFSICYIDARNVDRTKPNFRKHVYDLIYSKDSSRLIEWISSSYNMQIVDPTLASVFGFHTKARVGKAQVERIVGCDIVMVRETVVRELLYYSNVSMDSPSSFVSLSLIDEKKVHNSFDNLLSNEFISNVDFFPFSDEKKQIELNKEFKCPSLFNNTKEESVTFSVFIPMFKRNYFGQMMPQFDQQTHQPSFYLLFQNRFHIYIDVEKDLQRYLVNNKRPIYKVWAMNYNSFFILPNLVTSLINTNFVFRFDDDHILKNKNTLYNALGRTISYNRYYNTILGYRPSILDFTVGNFININKVVIRCEGFYADYVASPYIYSPETMKLSGRIRPFFLAGAEDLQLGLSAAIQCNTVSYFYPFNIVDLSDDKFRHELDREIQDYKVKYNYANLPDYLLILIT